MFEFVVLLKIVGLACVVASGPFILYFSLTKDARRERAVIIFIFGLCMLFVAWFDSNPDAVEKLVEHIALGFIGLVLAVVWWITRRIKRL